MIINCPECSKRYLVDDKIMHSGSRQVRCVSCGHSWLHSLEQSLASSQGADQLLNLEPIPRIPGVITPSLEDKFEGPKVPSSPWGWLIFWGVVLLLSASALLMREKISNVFTPMGKLYSVLGMGVEADKKKLKFENLSMLHYIENQKSFVMVKGEIINSSNKAQYLPPVKVQLKGLCTQLSRMGRLKARFWYGDMSKDQNCTVDQWVHPLTDKYLQPLGRVSFETKPHVSLPQATSVSIAF